MQYADDCVMFLNNENELYAALRSYGQISGLTLNLSKCEGLWLGSDKNRQQNCNLCGIKWPDQIICLGIYIGYAHDKNFKSNWSDKIDKIKNIVASFRERDLSLFGKIQVMKTFIISQFVLPVSLLTVPQKIVKQIENVLHEFLWGAKDKIKILKVMQELKHGGLNMVDLKCLFISFKAVWITRLFNCDPTIHSWAEVANLYYKPFLESNSSLTFNFDNSVHFPDLENLSQFSNSFQQCIYN